MENPENNIPNTPTLSVIEAARILGLGKNTIYEAIRADQIPTIGFGRTKRIPTKWIINLLNKWSSE